MKFIGLQFSLCEDNSAILWVKALDQLYDLFMAVSWINKHSEMINSLRSSVVLVFDEINSLHVAGEILICDFGNPRWNSC